jgi:LemA protein
MMFGFAMLIGLVLTGAIVLGLLWSVATYNGLAAAQAEYADAFGWMLERLRQRNGLLPGLVETARPFMRHEREILEAVQIAAQEQEALAKELASAKVDLAVVEKLRDSELRVGSALRRLLALSEVYAELRSNPGMVRASGEISAVGKEVLGARQAYNDSVARYNALRAPAPQALISGILGFSDAPSFDEPRAVLPQSPPPDAAQAPSKPQRLGTLKA